MKWCFLVNNIDLMMEFLGKLENKALERGDESVLVFNSKMAEYTKRNFFNENSKVISKVDWLAENYKKDYKDFRGISWKEFLPTFERKSEYINLNYENSVEIVSQLCQFFDFLFKTEKPDVLINEAPANIFNLIAYHFCRKYNAAYLGVIGSKFQGRIDIYDKTHTCSLYEKHFKDISSESIPDRQKQFAEKFIQDFTSHHTLPPYMDFQYSFSRSKGLERYIKRIVKLSPYFSKYLSNRNFFKNFDYESESFLKYNLLYLWRSFKRQLRKVYFKSQYKKDDNEGKFFLYPLHFHPEASTLVLAAYFSDQLNTIKNIAFSLPFPYRLYVKEHPVAIGTRVDSFYRGIKKLPNVVLISSNENNKELIEKSEGVITLTSTVGMEAALLGKPVYVLGDVFYQYHPLARKVKSFEELKQKINDNLISHNTVENLKAINHRFVISYFRNTIPGDVVEALKEKDANDYGEIYRSIKKIFSKIHE